LGIILRNLRINFYNYFFIAPISDRIILTKADNPRAAEPQLINSLIENNKGKDIDITYNVGEALNLAKSKSAIDDMILVTGSLYVVGEARSKIK